MTASPDQIFFLEFLGYRNLLEHFRVSDLRRRWDENNILINLRYVSSTGMDRDHLGHRGGGRGFSCRWSCFKGCFCRHVSRWGAR